MGAKAVIGGDLNANPVTSRSGTAFFPIASGITNPAPFSGPGSEAVTQQESPAGTWSLATFNVTQSSSGVATITFRKAAANGNQTIAISSGATGQFSDVSHSDVCSLGDLVDYELVASGTLVIGLYCAQFDNGGSNPTTMHAGGWIQVGNSTGVTYLMPSGYWPNSYSGYANGPGTEAGVQLLSRAPGALSRLGIFLNGGTQQHDVRINGATGNGTVPGAANAWSRDTTNSDTIASGDLWCYQEDASGGCNVNCWYIHHAASSPNSDLLGGGECTYAGSSPSFFGLIGLPQYDQSYATEANYQLQMPFGTKFTNARVYITSIGASTQLVIKTRINGADGNQVVISSTGGSGGWFEDVSHSDVVNAGDLVCYSRVNAGLAQNVTTAQSAITMQPSAGSETLTGVLAFSGISFSASGRLGETSTGVLAFSGVSFAASTRSPVHAAGVLAFSGISFLAFSGIEVSASGLAFSGISFAATAHDGASAGVGVLAFSGISFDAGGGGRVMEFDVAVLSAPPVVARASELDVAVVAAPGGVVARVAELDVAALIVPTQTTLGQVSELDVAVLYYPGPCATHRCQVWKITLKNGTVYGFTSLDTDITWLGQLYKTCKSLTSTASESSSDLKSVGNVELTGILDDSSISGEDLYSGLFDDAYVEVWVIPYDGQPDDQAPFRQAAGWIGKVTRGEYNFTADVVGPGARLGQAGVVDFYTPGCRWDFGVLDANGIGCPVNATSFAIVNIAVTGSTLRSLVDFTSAGTPPPVGGISPFWDQGTLIWQTGRNAGVTCQTETVDWSAGAVSLWDLAPYPPAPGDLFTLKPGCPKIDSACRNYLAYESFGGFPNVPGPDALQSNADSLFT